MHLAILIVLFFACFTLSWGRPVSYNLTPCQRHQRYPNSTGFEVDVKCDNMGYYEPLQCTKHMPRRCACYYPEKNLLSFDNEIQTCECHMAWHHDWMLGKRGCDLPACLPSGLFDSKRCCMQGVKKICQCQDTSTGEKIKGPDSNPTCARGAYRVVSTTEKKVNPEMKGFMSRFRKPWSAS